MAEYQFDLDQVYPDGDPMKARSGQTKSVEGLADARLLASQFDSFDLPDDSDLKRLKPGDFVKLSRNGERFWVKISGYIGRKWHGIIANKLIRNNDLAFGERIYFMRRHIHDFKFSK